MFQGHYAADICISALILLPLSQNMICTPLLANKYFYEVLLKLDHYIKRNSTPKKPLTDRQTGQRTDTLAPTYSSPKLILNTNIFLTKNEYLRA